MKNPFLAIEADRGVRRVVVRYPRGQADLAYTLLGKALPALLALDRELRAASAGRHAPAPSRS